MSLLALLVIAAMLVMNSIFAAFELALASISLGRLKLLAEQNKRGAAAALAMKQRMEASLAVVQIGITLVGAIAAATSGAGAEEAISPMLRERLGLAPQLADALAIALVVLPLAAVTIVLGELVPKSVAIRNSEWVCLTLSGVMRVFAMVVYPAVAMLEWVTKKLVGLFERRVPTGEGGREETGLAELRAHARALRTSRVIGAEEEKIILGSSKLTQVKVGDIIVPREDIVMLNADASLPELFEVIHLDSFTRFPVTKTAGDAQGIVGYVTLKDLIFLAKSHPADPSILRIARPLMEVDPEWPIGRAFGEMMREHVHMALARDAGGVVQGVVTLEDIMEEIVGDIQDEFDRLPRHITRAGEQWIVGGGATFGQMRRTMSEPVIAPSEPDESVLADWIDKNHKPHLKGGDVLTLDGFKVLVRKTRRNRMLEGLVTVNRGNGVGGGSD